MTVLDGCFFAGTQQKSKFSVQLQHIANYGTFASSVCSEYVLQKVANCNSKGLEVVPNYLREDVQELKMRKNNIRNLSNTSFDRYLLLNRLDLSYNQISVIAIETFHQQRLLTYLNLGHNPDLHKIDGKVLRSCNRLLYLKLDSTGLVNFPSNAMKWLPNLERLYLRNNELTSIHFKSCPDPKANASVYLSGNKISELTPETISIKCDLRRLEFQDNPVESVDPKLLSDLRIWSLVIGGDNMTLDAWSQAFRGISKSQIVSLITYPTRIRYIPQNFFNAFRTRSPSSLYMHGRGTSLDGVHPLAFRNLSGVYGLYISVTNITTIKPDYFNGMRQLQYLRLAKSIAYIKPSKSSWDNTDLVDIDLQYNYLKEIRAYTFRGLTALQRLDLSYNGQLAVVEITSFSGLHNLQSIDLSFTYIHRISLDAPLLKSFSLAGSRLGDYALDPGETFKSTLSLEQISLANTDLQTALLYNDVRNISLFQGLHNLTSLVLCRNPLRSLLSDMFAELSSLEYLDLANSDIWNIPTGTFRGLKSLRTLRLDNNLIQEVTFDHVRDLAELRHFVIKNNNINYLEKNFFRNKSFLSSIYLANNHFVGFNRSTFEDVSSSLTEVDISGNPIVCDCSSKWLAEWLTGFVQLENEQETICSPGSATLGPLRGKPLMMLASTDLCHPQITRYVSIAFPLLIVLVLVLVTYWHRWFLRHKLFLLKLAVMGYNEMEDGRNRDEFEYDLNIMFTDDCEEWLQQHLRPFIEESLPDIGRVVFGDDDLRLGMRVLDGVLYAVEHSFKTVLLLSKAAVQDHWFMLKFHLAMDYATDIGTENIILIFVEDIFNEDEFPYLVRLFLSGSGSYLSWVEEEEGQEYFWKKFEKYLNVNRRINHLLPAQ